MPYAGIDCYKDLPLLYTLSGDFSIILKVRNPALQYSANPDLYTAFHGLYLNLIRILGDGYILQKQDLFIRKAFQGQETEEYLQQRYAKHFQGRPYTAMETYVVITRQVKRKAFYVYDARQLLEFYQVIVKVFDLLEGSKYSPEVLSKAQLDSYVKRFLSADFVSPNLVLDNIRSEDRGLEIGARSVRIVSLVNTDSVDLPEKIGPYTYRQENSGLKDFPVDNMSFLVQVPAAELILFNQVIEIPAQQNVMNRLQVKRKRHSGVPDPVNLLCVEDIDRLLEDVARESQFVVNAHFSILIAADHDKLDKAANFIESALFQQGIIPSRNAYNQMELFRSAMPGNAVELKNYDWFLTTSDAALCFFFKECLPEDEPSEFLISFTDRQGVPVRFDPADLPMRTNRINNRNKFVLGPSGSGKSFLMNAFLEQYLLYNMDVVIVDTGHSYSGLCSYFGGKYITYSEKNPVTMNPFIVDEAEYNLEKKDFLCTLIALIWKGADGHLNQVERDVIANLISSYYAGYFTGEEFFNDQNLGFNSFYEFAMAKIPEIKREEKIPFDLDEFRYVLKKFYRGGEYDTILNEASDSSLFTERLVVFEVDVLKENKLLFPIVTLIIMDVFIQKMRNRQGQRKALILEEAWKAIASPMMGSYILYLYKTVRKFWGEAILVTQELGDIIGNAIVKDSIISNSDTVFLLDQSNFKDNYDEIARLLSITETERRKIFTINKLDNQQGRGRFKEVYIRRGNSGEVYGVEVALAQYLVYTTEKPEKHAVEIYALAFGNYPLALDHFIADMERSGLSLNQFVSRINQLGTTFSHSQEFFKPDLP